MKGILDAKCLLNTIGKGEALSLFCNQLLPRALINLFPIHRQLMGLKDANSVVKPFSIVQCC